MDGYTQRTRTPDCQSAIGDVNDTSSHPLYCRAAMTVLDLNSIQAQPSPYTSTPKVLHDRHGFFTAAPHDDECVTHSDAPVLSASEQWVCASCCSRSFSCSAAASAGRMDDGHVTAMGESESMDHHSIIIDRTPPLRFPRMQANVHSHPTDEANPDVDDGRSEDRRACFVRSRGSRNSGRDASVDTPDEDEYVKALACSSHTSARDSTVPVSSHDSRTIASAVCEENDHTNRSDARDRCRRVSRVYVSEDARPGHVSRVPDSCRRAEQHRAVSCTYRHPDDVRVRNACIENPSTDNSRHSRPCCTFSPVPIAPLSNCRRSSSGASLPRDDSQERPSPRQGPQSATTLLSRRVRHTTPHMWSSMLAPPHFSQRMSRRWLLKNQSPPCVRTWLAKTCAHRRVAISRLRGCVHQRLHCPPTTHRVRPASTASGVGTQTAAQRRHARRRVARTPNTTGWCSLPSVRRRCHGVRSRAASDWATESDTMDADADADADANADVDADVNVDVDVDADVNVNVDVDADEEMKKTGVMSGGEEDTHRNGRGGTRAQNSEGEDTCPTSTDTRDGVGANADVDAVLNRRDSSSAGGMKHDTRVDSTHVERDSGGEAAASDAVTEQDSMGTQASLMPAPGNYASDHDCAELCRTVPPDSVRFTPPLLLQLPSARRAVRHATSWRRVSGVVNSIARNNGSTDHTGAAVNDCSIRAVMKRREEEAEEEEEHEPPPPSFSACRAEKRSLFHRTNAASSPVADSARFSRERLHAVRRGVATMSKTTTVASSRLKTLPSPPPPPPPLPPPLPKQYARTSANVTVLDSERANDATAGGCVSAAAAAAHKEDNNNEDDCVVVAVTDVTSVCTDRTAVEDTRNPSTTPIGGVTMLVASSASASASASASSTAIAVSGSTLTAPTAPVLRRRGVFERLYAPPPAAAPSRSARLPHQGGGGTHTARASNDVGMSKKTTSTNMDITSSRRSSNIDNNTNKTIKSDNTDCVPSPCSSALSGRARAATTISAASHAPPPTRTSLLAAPQSSRTLYTRTDSSRRERAAAASTTTGSMSARHKATPQSQLIRGATKATSKTTATIPSARTRITVARPQSGRLRMSMADNEKAACQRTLPVGSQQPRQGRGSVIGASSAATVDRLDDTSDPGACDARADTDSSTTTPPVVAVGISTDDEEDVAAVGTQVVTDGDDHAVLRGATSTPSADSGTTAKTSTRNDGMDDDSDAACDAASCATCESRLLDTSAGIDAHRSATTAVIAADDAGHSSRTRTSTDGSVSSSSSSSSRRSADVASSSSSASTAPHAGAPILSARQPRPHALRTVTQHSTVTPLCPTLDVRDAHNQMHLSRNFLLPDLHPGESARVVTVVLDLDETLCYNRGITRAVLRPGALALVRRLRALYPAPRYRNASGAYVSTRASPCYSAAASYSSSSCSSSSLLSAHACCSPAPAAAASFGGERLYANTLQARLFGTSTTTAKTTATTATTHTSATRTAAPSLSSAELPMKMPAAASGEMQAQRSPRTVRREEDAEPDHVPASSGLTELAPGSSTCSSSAHADEGEGVLLELVLWTASVEAVARRVVSVLDPAGEMFDYTIYRDLRWYRSDGYTKDLRRLGRRMERVVIVENAPESVLLNRGNAILVSDFVSNRNDRQLFVVCAVLQDWLCHVDALLRAQSPVTEKQCASLPTSSCLSVSSLQDNKTRACLCNHDAERCSCEEPEMAHKQDGDDDCSDNTTDRNDRLSNSGSAATGSIAGEQLDANRQGNNTSRSNTSEKRGGDTASAKPCGVDSVVDFLQAHEYLSKHTNYVRPLAAFRVRLSGGAREGVAGSMSLAEKAGSGDKSSTCRGGGGGSSSNASSQNAYLHGMAQASHEVHRDLTKHAHHNKKISMKGTGNKLGDDDDDIAAQEADHKHHNSSSQSAVDNSSFCSSGSSRSSSTSVKSAVPQTSLLHGSVSHTAPTARRSSSSSSGTDTTSTPLPSSNQRANSATTSCSDIHAPCSTSTAVLQSGDCASNSSTCSGHHHDELLCAPKSAMSALPRHCEVSRGRCAGAGSSMPLSGRRPVLSGTVSPRRASGTMGNISKLTGQRGGAATTTSASASRMPLSVDVPPPPLRLQNLRGMVLDAAPESKESYSAAHGRSVVKPSLRSDVL